MRTSTVIVPVGMRQEAERLLPIAAEVANAFDAPMKIVHVVTYLDSYTTVGQREWLAPLATRYGAELLLVEHQSVSSGLRDVIVGYSDAVVCMAVDATGGRIDGLLGSISEDMLRASHHRFVLVGPSVRRTRSINDGPVVVCTDGSAFSETILVNASEWANATSGAAWAVQVVDRRPLPSDVVESAYIQAIASDLDVPDAEWEMLHHGNPADAIVDFATGVGAGSIVMATHGRTGLERLALGSVAIRVVHEAPCPVLVRRPAALVGQRGAGIARRRAVVMSATPRPAASADRLGLEILRPEECWERLAAAPIGRIAFVDAGEPIVLPVTHGVHGHQVVFRSAPGTKLSGAGMAPAVAFEVDDWDVESRTGWSVLVRGTCEPIYDDGTIAELESLGVSPWLGAAAEGTWVSLRPDEISGRRLR